jgi:hypothetical protein
MSESLSIDSYYSEMSGHHFTKSEAVYVTHWISAKRNVVPNVTSVSLKLTNLRETTRAVPMKAKMTRLRLPRPNQQSRRDPPKKGLRRRQHQSRPSLPSPHQRPRSAKWQMVRMRIEMMIHLANPYLEEMGPR